jgi:hypothetical protein
MNAELAIFPADDCAQLHAEQCQLVMPLKDGTMLEGPYPMVTASIH